MIAEGIKKLITDALAELGLPEAGFSLEHPADASHGEYATNVALILGKRLGRNPRELAEEIVKNFQHRVSEILGLERVEVAGAGFINFHLSREFFAREVAEIVEKGGEYGKGTLYAGKKVMVEYSQPNPFKTFHIGHVKNTVIGESISRLIEWQGAEVKRANYQGDVGPHVAKALWWLIKHGGDAGNPAVLAAAYVKGTEAYERDERAKKEIDSLNKKIYERSPDIMPLYTQGRATSLAEFKKMYGILDTNFVFSFFESEMWERGKEIVKDGLRKGVFEESEGAVVYRGEREGLHTRVFITREGIPLYEAKDLALAVVKHETYPFDVSITITGIEQEEYFRVVIAALDKLYPELVPKILHLSQGLMLLASGKMSSRKGNVVAGESFLNEVIGRAGEKVSERVMGGDADKMAQAVGVAAIKYSILKQALGKNIIFDKEKSLSFEGDSGPYLQYSAVRAGAILEKVEKEGIAKWAFNVGDEYGTLNVQQQMVEQLVYRFPEVAAAAAREFAPHQVAQYLTSLAGAFNSWYAAEKIVDPGDPASPYKVALTRAVEIALTNGLWLLGIAVPERM